MKKLFLVFVLISLNMQVNAQDIENGQKVFDHWCGACHAPGPKHPGTQALEALYQGSLPAALEDRTDMTEEFVTTLVRTGVSIMPFFRKTEVSDTDLKDLSHYLTISK